MNNVLMRITQELERQKLKDKDLCEYVGISPSTFSTWKSKDREPKPTQLTNISKFLNVSVEYLLTGENASHQENTSETILTKRDKRDIAKDVDSIMTKLTSGEDGPASFDGEPLSPESAELFREELQIALKRLKIINKEKYNPNKYK